MDLRNTKLLSVNKIENDVNFRGVIEGNSSKFYEFNLCMEKSSKTIKKPFMKIQDVGAKVGGIIKVILIIF